MFKVGYHVPVSGNYYKAVTHAHVDNDATAIQIWTGNPKSYLSKKLENTEIVKTYVEDNDLFLISHSPYILNFARKPDKKVLNRYIMDLHNISSLGGKGSVLHMGFNVKSLGQTHEEACQNMIRGIDLVARKTPKDSTVILENMAGKGTAMCCEMDGWGEFSEMIPEDLYKRISWCVDTAHLHGVGEYNLSMRREAMRFYDDFENLIGWDKLLCFHFNGSKALLGSKKDLHADIGNDVSGNIETKGLRHLARIANETQKPLIMEIPGDESPVAWQIATVKSWVDLSHPMHTEWGRVKIVEKMLNRGRSLKSI